MVLAPQSVCTVCGKAFTFEFPPFSPQPTLYRIRHCKKGNHVDVPGKVAKLLEVKENKLVQPVYGDLLDDEPAAAEGKTGH